VNAEAARMQHFHALNPAQQAEAVRRLAAAGYSPHGIASATHLSVEMIAAILADRVAA
jgi:hypothetical protein